MNQLLVTSYISKLIYIFPTPSWILDLGFKKSALLALWVNPNMYLVEADDVGVPQQLHDLDLSEDLFQVLIIQLGLIHYFYSHLETKEIRKG